MASFPTSVFAPAARSNGQVIDASHVNDLQNEVIAIEDGYRNATAPLNSSNSTVGNLSVLGGTTLAARPVMPPPDVVKVFLQSTVTVGSSAESTIAWTSQDILTNSSLHSTSVDPTRMIPQSTGVYRFDGSVVFSPNSTGTRQIVLRDSSGTAFGTALASSAAGSIVLSVFGIKRFDAVGGYAVVSLSLAGASTLSLDSGLQQTQMTMAKL